MIAVNELRETLPVARISRALDIPRSFIYYSRSGRMGKRKRRISSDVEEQIRRIAGERTTYGYRRIWAVMRNSGTPVNIKTVRRVMKAHNLSLPYAKHRKEGSNKARWHKQAPGN